MARTIVAFSSLCFLLASGCGQGDRPEPKGVDCKVLDAYEFLNISNFDSSESGWFQYADPSPGGLPDTSTYPACSNIPVTELDEPRCGDNRVLELEMDGKNFWGAGFGDWAHNPISSRADGTGYEGISFWARSAVNAEKQFFLNVDDSRTIIFPPEPDPLPDAGAPEPNTCAPPRPDDVLPTATSADQDLDGDGFVGPGDIARGTDCRLPPPSDLGEATCYNGGVDGPASAGVRVPARNECGNAFHTRITTTETWQLILIPWKELVQWPCPNRLDGGIDRADIAKFEVKFDQGMRYDVWLDNIAFYRSRGN